MNQADYPALFAATDEASMRAQARYLRAVRSYVIVSIVGAALALLGTEAKLAALLAAAVFGLGLFISVWMAVMKYEHTWYRARAAAESVKTVTWRFMMRSKPFDSRVDPAQVKSSLVQVLRRILEEHKDLARELGDATAAGEPVSREMIRVRELALDERKELYGKDRIEDQKKWYAAKAAWNDRVGTAWFAVMVLLQVGTVTLTLMRIAYPDWKYWPIEVLVVAASGILMWIQAKRFRELAAAYGLAAQEISLVSAELNDVKDEAGFDKFVGDAENAFSREHTQWVARKG